MKMKRYYDFRFYWWTPDMNFGYHEIPYDGELICALNLFLFSADWKREWEEWDG